ncbi:hypothetical protein D3C76_955580 [compost metagenome]
MLKQHNARQDNGTRVHDVFVRIFRCSTVSSFEDRMACYIVDVRSRSDTDTTNLCSKCVGQVVTVQVQCSNNIEFAWTSQYLLQSNVGNRIFNNDFTCIFSCFLSCIRCIRTFFFLDDVVLCPSEHFIAEFFLSDFITPVFEGTFSKFHDVAFVYQCHALTVVIDGVLNCCTYQTFGTFGRYWLDTDTRSFRETDFVNAHFLLQELNHFFHFIGTFSILDTSVDIFCILTENDHVYQFRTFNRGRHSVEIAYRTQASVQVKLLTQCYVQGTNSATDWRRQRSFDGYDILTNCFKRIIRQPLTVCIECFLTSKHFIPCNFFAAIICFFNSCIQYTLGSFPDVAACTVTFDKRNDRVIRHLQCSVINLNFFPFSWMSEFF